MRKTDAKLSGGRQWWMGGVLALIVGAVLVLVWLRPEPRTREVSGPGSDPTIAHDVNTLLGEKAPTLSLPDASGKLHTITPGRGRPLVVISHMGFY